MARIYVSSTYLDLKECREQVALLLRRTGHEDVSIGYYTTGENRPMDRCLADVAASDLYVGIFAWRYGWIPPQGNPDQLSITELEYRQALRTGKECLIFLLHEDAPWPRKHIDTDGRIDQLRQAIIARHGCAYFNSAQDISSVIGPAIYQWASQQGLVSPGVSAQEFDREAYYTALRKHYQRLDLEGLTPPQKEEYLQLQLRAVFVEQGVRENPPPVELSKEAWEKLHREREVHREDLPIGMAIDDFRRVRETYYEKPAQAVLDVLTDPRYNRVIILGDPGSGKSTLARYVLLSLIDSAANERVNIAFDGYLPLLIELRSYAGLRADGKCHTFLEFLEYTGREEGWHITQDMLRQYLKINKKALVILDGLDEIFDPEDRERITRQIVSFASDYPEARIIATSRIIGYRRKILADADFAHFTLQDLNESQVDQFVSGWYELALRDRPAEARDRRTRILRSFKQSASIRQLAGNPMLLTIMAIIGKHQELPRERWKLYDHAASVLIEHWDVNKHLAEQSVHSDFIGEEDKKEMLRRLAHRMQAGAGGLAGNYIPREELQAEFESYLTDRYGQTPDRAKVVAQAIINQLRERNFILSLFGANLYGFVHRAFLEYFCATAIIQKFEKAQEITLDQLKRDIYGKHLEDQSWHEVLRLICGMIDEKFAGEIISYLAGDQRLPSSRRSSSSPYQGITLAVQCLGEVRNLSAVARAARYLLKAVCHLFEEALDYWIRPQILDTQIAPAVEIIGPNWPHREDLAEWLKRYTASDEHMMYAASLGVFIGSVGSGLNSVHQIVLNYSTSSSANYRVLATQMLSQGWKRDPRTLPLLLDRAANDSQGNVRRSAVSALAEHFPHDPQVLPFLLDRAANDSYEHARSSVVSALAEHFRDDPQVLPLLLDRIANDSQVYVRDRSLSALAEHFRDDPRTLPLLLDRAANDSQGYVRRSAMSALAEHFRDDPRTLPLLLDRAANDPQGNVRYTAVSALAEHFRDDPRTLPLLLDFAANDSQGYVRRSAVSALAEHFPDDPRTLPLLLGRAAHDSEEDVRYTAVSTLAEHFRDDPRTLPLLLDRAANDSFEHVRRLAVSALAEHFRDDPRTLPLLLDRAANDSQGYVRYTAVSALAEHFRDDPRTLPLLLDRIANDSQIYVRDTAVSALAEHFRDDPRTLPLLLDFATNDSEGDVRYTAVSALAAHFRDDPRTLPLLLDRAANDSFEHVRRSAVSALAEHFRDDLRTLPLLLDRAANDSNEEVRANAIRALIRLFQTEAPLFSLLYDLSQNAPNEATRVLAIGELTRGWPDDPRTLPLLDKLAADDQPESVRLAALTKALIRKRKLLGWACWLNGSWDEADFANLPLTDEDQVVVLVSSVRLRNIRVFTDTGEIRFNRGEDSVFRPVTLLLGDNAAGKSTLLRCIGLASLGLDLANQIEKRPESYLRHGADRGYIEVVFRLQLYPTIEPTSLGAFCVGLEIRSGEKNFRAIENADLSLGHYNAASRLDSLRIRTNDKFGFVCGYGALRSLADNPGVPQPEESKEILDRVISLFRSTAPVMDPDVLGRLLAGDLSYFRNAPTKKLDKEVQQSMALHIRNLLPDLGEIKSDESALLPLGGVPVPLRDLSDGYGSLLALVGHLFRHILSARNWEVDPAQVFGILLVDEIDLHLHPSWQRQVLPDLCRVFPRLQIIGTSHSAIVAGSVTTDSIVVLRRAGERVRVINDIPSVDGWRADQILTSLLFDLPTTRNLETEKLLSRYANLLAERGPEDVEVRELGKLVSEALNMDGEGVVDRYTHQLLDELLRKRFEALEPDLRNKVLAKAELILSNGKEQE